MKCICITGVDKSGKSTLINELWEITNAKYYIDDRDLSTRHFFNILLGRVSDDDKVYTKEYKNKLSAYRQLIDLAVILEVSEEDWIKRCKEHGEPKLIGHLSFSDHQQMLTHYFEKARYPNVLRLNTTKLSQEDCIKLILKRLGIRRT